MLDDGDGGGAGGVELRHAFEGRVGVVDVVVGEGLALHLPGGGDAKALLGCLVEACGLVGVFPIAHLLGQMPAHGPVVRRGFADLRGEPVGDRRVIGGGARIGLLGEVLAQGERGRARVGLQGVQHRLIIADFDHHGHIAMVLGRAANHGGAADVDVLDAIVIARAFRDRGLEGVEIDHQEVNGPDAMGQHGRLMLGILADGEQAAVHDGVQGLDAPVHHLGKAREVRDILHGQARVRQRLAGAPGRDQFNAPGAQGAGEFDEARLVGDGQEGARNAAKVGGHGNLHSGWELALRSLRALTTMRPGTKAAQRGLGPKIATNTGKSG